MTKLIHKLFDMKKKRCNGKNVNEMNEQKNEIQNRGGNCDGIETETANKN